MRTMVLGEWARHANLVRLDACVYKPVMSMIGKSCTFFSSAVATQPWTTSLCDTFSHSKVTSSTMSNIYQDVWEAKVAENPALERCKLSCLHPPFRTACVVSSFLSHGRSGDKCNASFCHSKHDIKIVFLLQWSSELRSILLWAYKWKLYGGTVRSLFPWASCDTYLFILPSLEYLPLQNGLRILSETHEGRSFEILAHGRHTRFV